MKAAKNFLMLFSVFVFLSMFGATFWASSQSNVVEGFRYLFGDRWGVATLGDTYFGFFFIYIWIAYKLNSLWARLLWFVLVCCFGTLAISLFVLNEVRKLRPDEGLESILRRRNA